MKTNSVRKFAAAVFCFGTLNYVAVAAPTESVVTAVFSRSFNNYQRPALADGRSQPLTYVIAKGGRGENLSADESMDGVKFASIVKVLGKYLAKQSYYPAKDAKKADLMLVVHWGKTIPGGDEFEKNVSDQGIQGFQLSQQLKMGTMGKTTPFAKGGPQRKVTPEEAAVTEAAQEQTVQGMVGIRFGQDLRDEANRHNANLLGYTKELSNRASPTLYAGTGMAYYDLTDDLEAERYYVSVTAYDFQEALQHKNNKGLWRTVASIEARGNRFDEQLMAMIERASRYFGRETDGLMRQFEYTPRINFGELKQLGLVDQVPSQSK